MWERGGREIGRRSYGLGEGQLWGRAKMPGDDGAAQSVRVNLEVLLAVVGAHRNERGGNDHRQENQRQNEIVNQDGPPTNGSAVS